MADNYTANAGAGGDTFAADEIAAVKHPRVKVQYGVDGAATDVSDTNPLPIDDAGGSLTVDGTVTANLSATDNAVLDSIDTAVNATLTVDLGANNDVTINASSVVGAEDAAAGTDGILINTVRDDEVGATAVASADGDLQALRSNQFGELKVTQIPDSTSEFKYASIDAALSGDNTLVAAAGAGIKIRVVSVFIVAAGAVNVRFESGAGGTALTGQMNLTTNSGFTLPFNPAGWFETADNALLNLELSAAISVDGCVTYVEI
jgi:hypothetical protein